MGTSSMPRSRNIFIFEFSLHEIFNLKLCAKFEYSFLIVLFLFLIVKYLASHCIPWALYLKHLQNDVKTDFLLSMVLH